MSSQQQNKREKWRTRAFAAWTLVGICILAGVVLYICNIIWQAVATVIVTALAVFLLHGIVNRVEHARVPRALSVTIVFVAVSAIIAGCVLTFIPAMLTQLSSLVSNLSGYTAQLQDFLTNHSHLLGSNGDELMSDLLTTASSWIKQQAGTIMSQFADGVIGSLVGLGNVVLIGFISLVCSFWILLDLPVISREVRGLFPEKRQGDLDIFGDAFGNAVYGWAKSTLLCALITGIASGVSFWICGIPYSGLLGFMCGILYIVPYLGPMVSCFAVAVIALFVSPLVCIISIVICVVINNVVGNIISPKLMESSVNVHPALILVAILVGGALGGIAGMLLSIPVVAAAQGLFVTYYEARTGKKLATPGGALFQEKKEAKVPKIDTGKWHIPGRG